MINTKALTRKDTADREKAARLTDLFREYADAYASEWQRLRKNERVYRGEHWHDVPMESTDEPRPVTPVVQSTIENIRADLFDMLPEAVITSDDPAYERQAELAGAVINENHVRTDYAKEYGRLTHDLLVGGYMVQEAGFDAELCGGLGGAFLRHVDVQNIMIDPIVCDVQASRAVFKFTPYPVEWFRERYPEKADELKDGYASVDRVRDDVLYTRSRDELMLIECWQREFDREAGVHRIHMAKLAGGVLLEDSRDIKPEGYFSHGMYPFVVTPMFIRKGTALGYGLVDIFESQQRCSDKLDQIMLKNAFMASRNKLLITGASGFDPEDLRDWAKEVHRGENLSGVTWFPTPPLPSYIMQYANGMREGIKEESGANDFSRGATTGGVTAASAIAALQEMGSKRSRMTARLVHGAFCEAVRMEIEVEREFCVFPREVTVGTGEGAKRVGFTGCQLENNGLPIELTVTVRAQKENRFTTAAHNELMLSLVERGMLTPEAGLAMMRFDGHEQAMALMRGSRDAKTV